jgi:cellulase/cellobiase CelA1
MRYTKREQVLVVLAGALAVAVVVLLGFALFHGPTRPPTTGAPMTAPHPSTTTAQPSAAGSPAALKTEYAVRGRWPGGFNAELVVTNLGSQPVEGWTVRLRLPPDVKVGRVWSASLTQVPDAVILRSQPWNTYLAPGAAVSLGFEATGTPATPSSCTVNGVPC